MKANNSLLLFNVSGYSGYSYDHYHVRNFYARSKADVIESVSDLRHVSSYGVIGRNTLVDNPRLTAELNHVEIMFRDSIACANTVLDSWLYREHNRLAQGTYQPIPEAISRQVHFDPFHCVHLPSETDNADKSKIAYTESSEKGRIDKQTVCAFGRYLKKYCPTFSDKDIERLVVLYRSEQTMSKQPAEFSLHFATDKETINAIFETEMGADAHYNSCMYDKFTHWTPRPYHVYADSPDVAVAYMKDSQDNILARSVVTTGEGNKYYVRVYARMSENEGYSEENKRNHEAYRTKFLALLKEAGCGEQGNLRGCRLTRCFRHGEVIAPYLDGSATGFDDNGQYFVVSRYDGEYTADSTEGIPSDNGSSRTTCEDCGNRCDDDESSYVEDVGTVCESCYSDNYVQATDYSRYDNSYGRRNRDEITIRRDDAVTDCQGNYYTQRAAEHFLSYFQDMNASDEEYHDVENCDHSECYHSGDTCADYASDDDCNCACDDCKTERDERKERAEQEEIAREQHVEQNAQSSGCTCADCFQARSSYSDHENQMEFDSCTLYACTGCHLCHDARMVQALVDGLL